MQAAEVTVTDLAALVGADRILTDSVSLHQPEGVLVRQYEKAFGYEPDHLPICIVKVNTTGEVVDVLRYCNENLVHVIAQTGASSSEDQLLVIDDNTVVLDCLGLNEVISIDKTNMMATVGAGVKLEDLEALANAQGLTTGHWPQSQPLACMGGLVATRSIGQFSTYYGGIEDMLCGLEAVLPNGEIVRMRPVPRAAAGPDLRHLIMGSEGAFAVITEVTVKLFTYYPDRWRQAYVVPSFNKGIDILRDIIVAGFKPAVVRLYDKADMDANYGSVDLEEGEACMFFVAEGPADITAAIGKNVDSISKAAGAREVGPALVDHWLKERNEVCKILGTETILERYRESEIFYTTCEISASWSDIKNIYARVTANLPKTVPNLVMLGGHVSHSYQNGTNIYFVYKLKAEDQLTMHTYDAQVKNAIVTEVLKETTGGAIHHHGVGKMRVKRIREELGSSYPLLTMLKEQFDPNGIMNPGTLVPLDV